MTTRRRRMKRIVPNDDHGIADPTPEMIAAGISILDWRDDIADDQQLIRMIYRAMMAIAVNSK